METCKGKGEVGVLLRREGLYSSLVSKWREQLDRGSLTGLSGKQRGPKVEANAEELLRLQRENKRLQAQLERAELIIDVQKKNCAAGWSRSTTAERGALMQTANVLSEKIGKREACAVLGIPRSSLHRSTQPRKEAIRPKVSPRALSSSEKQVIRAELNSVRFQDCAPREVYAALMDEERYLCSWRTMYRVLEESLEVRERRNLLRHPSYTKPELLATAPNQLWSWDITKLLGHSKWTYFYLYVILDVFSRYVVGSRSVIAERESAALAEELISQTCARQGIQRGQLTIHADRGSAMTSKPVAFLLADLGVTKTHSRPHVSNDNPYSEAQFKTMKYRPDYPTRFGCLQDARAWAAEFFHWYNREHHHTGLALLTPADVHFHRAEHVLQKRQAVLNAAYEKMPERFVKGVSSPAKLPDAVWINPPTSTTMVVERPTRNENENSHCKSAVPVSFGAMPIVHEFYPQKVAPIFE